MAVLGRILSSVPLLVLLSLLCPRTTEGQQINCQSSFLNRFAQCVTNSSIDAPNFFWLTRDGKMGSEPSDLQTFTKLACQAEDSLSSCFQTVVDQYQTSTGCSDEDKNAILTFHKGVVRTLMDKCVHPCGKEVMPSLAQCLSNVGVNGSLLLSSLSRPRHSMLGVSHNDTTNFCTNREQIMECMQNKTAMCPESPNVLMEAGVDVLAMNNTVALLCDNIQLYEHGARCGQKQGRMEVECHDTLLGQLSSLETQFQTLSIDRNTYASDLCRIRLDHIRCDLNSLSRRDNVTKCPDVVVGLRREQECTLVPDKCRQEFKERVMDTCDPMRFMREKRRDFIQALKSTSAAHVIVSQIFVSILLLFCSFIFNVFR